VQDLSHLENALSSASPRYSALNMAICELVEDFGLVGFETLAVEVRAPQPRPVQHDAPSTTLIDLVQDKHSMLNLTHVIDRATGYVFVPPAAGAQQQPQPYQATPASGSSTGPGAEPPRSALPNAYALMSSAMGPRGGLRGDVRDVQERWVDAREEWDAYERAQWRDEGEALRRAVAEVREAGEA
jgi:hypothetical protein